LKGSAGTVVSIRRRGESVILELSDELKLWENDPFHSFCAGRRSERSIIGKGSLVLWKSSIKIDVYRSTVGDLSTKVWKAG
jgi:hypothetical protein